MNDVEKKSSDMLPLNRLYWKDQLGNCQAFSVMTTWRMADLARGCVWALARGDVICAALMARSSIETAANYVDFSRRVCATLIGETKELSRGRLVDPSVDFRTNSVTIAGFEDLGLKTLFASRLAEAEGFYNPVNIQTVLDKTSKGMHQTCYRNAQVSV
jgi:hypothetical protein